MKFVITAAVILALNGFLNAQQAKLLGEDDRVSAAQTSTETIKSIAAKSGLVQPPQAAAGGFMVGKKHAVVKGDTLWGLSQKYYGDPFKWGGIYNANAGTIKVPDLIHPADELVIPDITEEIKPEPGPSAQNTAIPETVNEALRDSEAAAAAMPPSPDAKPDETAVTAAKEPAPAVKSEDFDLTDLSEDMPQDMKEWRTEVKIVPDNWTEAGVITAKESADDGDYSFAVSGEVVLIRVANPAAFKSGDTLTSYMKGAGAFDRKGKRLGREIQKTGMLEVMSVNGDMVKARVIDASTAINKGQVIKK